MTDHVTAIIVAAGSGTRMGGIDKVFSPLCGVPVLARSAAPFQASDAIGRIVLVVAADRLDDGRALASQRGLTKVTAIVEGGPRRQDSVRLGLDALGACDYVLVHDGPRPFVTAELIERGLAAARETGAAVPAVPVTETVKEAGPEGLVVRTLDRGRLWAVQTPQVFRYDLLMRAHREITTDVTDDASMLEALGLPVQLYEGSRTNMKITTPEDLLLGGALLQMSEGPCA